MYRTIHGKSKCVDQLRVHRADDMRLSFRIRKKIFLGRCSIVKCVCISRQSFASLGAYLGGFRHPDLVPTMTFEVMAS